MTHKTTPDLIEGKKPLKKGEKWNRSTPCRQVETVDR
jgi:hypothetical protein